VDVALHSVMVELAGTEEKIEAFTEMLAQYGIKELARTGVIAMARGAQNAKDAKEAGAAPAGGGKRKRSLSAGAAPALPPS
jgi:acetolactate synthase-1/3 small subunit